MARALSLALCVCLSACAGAQHPKRERPTELRIVAVPEGALVEVNERRVGSARVLAQRPVRLKPGKKRITITAPGYFPHDLEVELQPGETKIDIKLRPVPK